MPSGAPRVSVDGLDISFSTYNIYMTGGNKQGFGTAVSYASFGFGINNFEGSFAPVPYKKIGKSEEKEDPIAAVAETWMASPDVYGVVGMSYSEVYSLARDYLLDPVDVYMRKDGSYYDNDHFIPEMMNNIYNSKAYQGVQSVGDTDNWVSNFKTAAVMTMMWATGIRSSNNAGTRYENDRIANAMRNAWKVNEAREFFYKKYKGESNLSGASVTNYRGEFGLEGFFRAGVDPIEQFIGSYRIDIHAIDGNLQFTLTNTTSFRSLMYGVGPDWQGGPMGNYTQTYVFTEPIR